MIDDMKINFKTSFAVALPVFGVSIAILSSLELHKHWSLTVSFLVGIISFLTSVIIKFNELNKNKYHLIKTGDGTESVDEIRKTEHTIVVTNFTEGAPSIKYISSVLERMDDRVHLIRYLPVSIDRENEENSWIKKFEGHRNYTEKMLCTEKFPFDILILDGKTVKISFPPSKEHREYLQGLVINDREVADMFSIMLQRLEDFSKLRSMNP